MKTSPSKPRRASSELPCRVAPRVTDQLFISKMLSPKMLSQAVRILGISILSALLMSTSLLALSSSPASAREPTYGVGLRLGSLSGITGQYRLSAANALNAGLSYDLLDPSIDLSLDHIFINTTPLLLGVLYPYFGWGGRLRLYDRLRIGFERDSNDLFVIAQAPIGVEVKCSRRAWCVRWRGFIELVPGLLVFPRVDFAISGALGVRYHF